SSLTRTEACGYPITAALTPDQLPEMTEDGRAARVIPVEDLFPDAKKLSPDPFFVRLLRNGLRVETRKLGLANEAPGTRFRVFDDGVFFALAEVAPPDEARGETLPVLVPLRQFDV
ncbi:MAG: hypothetical protein J6X72_02030, partial [Clostridia bacterium]|nr:hypothetical protein [Clostridia bacterium]